MALFGKPKYTIVRVKKKDIPDGLWTKCEECQEALYNKNLEENLKVCPKCNYHFVLGSYERINTLIDKETFDEYDRDMLSVDPLDFKGPKTYKEKIEQDQKLTGLKDAAGIGDIVDELQARDFDIAVDVVAVSQGWRLNGAIKTTERKLAGGDLLVAKSGLMPWSVSNARTVQQGNAVSITKQASGTAKIDPLMALFNAVTLMSLNPAGDDSDAFNDFITNPIGR